METKFGNLTVTKKAETRRAQRAEISRRLNRLFSSGKYERTPEMLISDNEIAMRRLNDLTNTLLIRNLRQKSGSFCEYFIL